VVTQPVVGVAALTGSTLTLSWNSIAGERYRVQYKSDLNETDWTDLSGDVTASGSVTAKMDTRTAANRFYRVQVLP